MPVPHVERIAAAITAFRRANEAFLAELNTVSEPERAPEDGGWTPAQIAWHLAETNLYVAGMIAGRLPGPTQSPGFSEDPAVFSKIPERVATPIPDVHPPADVTRQDAVARLRATEAPTIRAIEALPVERASSFTVEFPFGTINLYQVAEFVGAHVMRHQAQLRRAARPKEPESESPR
jgi:hypothetical protein